MIPPHPEAMARMLAIPGVSADPTMLIRHEGPGAGGPETAGAVLMLQTTFTSEEGARDFWDAAAPLMELLSDAPGFIRRYTFPEPNCGTLIAFWRTLEDAKAFARLPEHREAVKGLYRGRWQQSHFTGMWELASDHGRVIFCDHCDGITPAHEGVCSGCGRDLADIYRSP